MSKQSQLIGAYAAIYIGDTLSAVDPLNPAAIVTNTITDPLILVTDQRTEGSDFIYKQPTKFNSVDGNDLPDGENFLSFSLTFYDSNFQTMALEMGNSINPSNTAHQDTPGQNNVYTILMIDYLSSSQESVWIPWAVSEKTVDISRKKDSRTKTTVKFSYRHRSAQLFYKRDVASLLALPGFGGRSLTTP